MSPFLQLRLWARRAPTGERLVAACLALIVLAVASWSLVSVGPAGAGTGVAADGGGTPAPAAGGQPSGAPVGTGPARHHPNTSTGSGATTGSGRAGAVGTGTGTGGGVRGGGSATTGRGHRGSGQPTPTGSASAAPGCGPMTSTDQGVTAQQIHIDVDVANLAGQAGNTLVGLPSAKTEQKMFAAAIAATNARGGVRCRTLVAKYYTANPLLQSSLQSLCLNMVADHPFALLDDGLGSPVGSPTPRDCPPAHQVPEFGSLSLSQKEVDQYAPYLFGYYPTAERIVNDSIYAAKQLGWFKGAKRIGLLEQECNPALNPLAVHDLGAIGFPSSRVTTFDFGCPNDIPSPLVVQNAVLRFKAAGVTNVLDDGGVYENYFANQAATQGYKPRYMVGDEGSIALWDNRAFGPNPKNFSGALAITATQYGAENTPGAHFSAATADCNKAMAARHLPSATRSPDGFAGVACTLVTMFAEAADNAPQLRRDQLATGLHDLGQLSFPFPAGPANFAASHGQYGGGYWRADTWHTSCACFQVSRPTFTPSFP